MVCDRNKRADYNNVFILNEVMFIKYLAKVIYDYYRYIELKRKIFEKKKTIYSCIKYYYLLLYFTCVIVIIVWIKYFAITILYAMTAHSVFVWSKLKINLKQKNKIYLRFKSGLSYLRCWSTRNICIWPGNLRPPYRLQWLLATWSTFARICRLSASHWNQYHIILC